MRSSQAQATLDAILEAALACFAEAGFGDTTTRGIAARAEVTLSLIHHYFGSKAALYDAVLARVIDDYERAQARQWRRDPGTWGF